jgi:hypothetical protein
MVEAKSSYKDPDPSDLPRLDLSGSNQKKAQVSFLGLFHFSPPIPQIAWGKR